MTLKSQLLTSNDVTLKSGNEILGIIRDFPYSYADIEAMFISNDMGLIKALADNPNCDGLVFRSKSFKRYRFKSAFITLCKQKNIRLNECYRN